MSLTTIILTALALAMDAFAVSLAIGLSDKKNMNKNSIECGLTFGSFQGLMTAIGFLLGLSFIKYIKPIDHYISFVLLVFIGAKMIYESFNIEDPKPLTGLKMLFVLGLATSIDAMAAGLSFSSLTSGSFNILSITLIIGIISLLLSFFGVRIGAHLSKVKKLEKYANILGGIVLISIAIKILIEHLIKNI